MAELLEIFDLLCYSPWCLPKLMGESGNTIESSKEIYPSLPVSSTMNFVDDEISGLHYVANKGTCPDLSRTGIDIWGSGFGTWSFRLKSGFSYLSPDMFWCINWVFSWNKWACLWNMGWRIRHSFRSSIAFTKIIWIGWRNTSAVKWLIYWYIILSRCCQYWRSNTIGSSSLLWKSYVLTQYD